MVLSVSRGLVDRRLGHDNNTIHENHTKHHEFVV